VAEGEDEGGVGEGEGESGWVRMRVSLLYLLIALTLTLTAHPTSPSSFSRMDSSRQGTKRDQRWTKIKLDELYPMNISLFPENAFSL
jgi:hypothetical protein